MMDEPLKISPWDASEFLETTEDIADFLKFSFESGDLMDIASALRDALKALERIRGTQDKLAPITLDSVVESLGYLLTAVPKNHEPYTLAQTA